MSGSNGITPEGGSERRRILLLGATGQVGWELSRSLQPLGRVIVPRSPSGAGRAVDLTQPDDLRTLVRNVHPDLIVNAAAYTAVDKAEQQADVAMAVNGVAPGVLAEEARRLNAAMVHYSTDYVFDGSGQRPWRENDPTGPLSSYGRSKLAGEEAVRASGASHLILRVCWVHGVHGANFVKTMLRLGSERASLSIVDDQFGAPTSARVIADVTAQILAQGIQDSAARLRERGGTVHLACGGETTWYGFAAEIFESGRARGIPLAVQEIKPIPSSQYPTPAVRPKNSRMDCTLLRERFGLVAPDWKTALEHCLDGMIRPAVGATPTTAAASTASATLTRQPPAARVLEKATPTADLDVGVIYTHERAWMSKLLSTLRASSGDLSVRLILVDNDSEDGIDQWQSMIANTAVLRNESALGYAPNLNKILEAATAPYVLLLNTDMYFAPGENCLAKMVEFMNAHPECGVSGCRLYHPDGSYAYPARRFQDLRVVAGRRTPLSPLLRSSVDRYLYKERQPTEVFECDWLSGCFLMVRRAAYEAIGGFDCGFTKYFEDVDFCLRMARGGWRVMFNGKTYCYHGEQRASRQLFSRSALAHLRSYSRWIAKWGLSPERTEKRAA